MRAVTLLAVSATSVFADLSYDGQCQWMGADGMHGPYLPVGVCKHIFDPHDLSDPLDDHRYSQKYVCSEDGTLMTQAWGNNSFCEGEPGYEAPAHVQGSEGDYFSCSASQSCPYAVIRFYDQQDPNDTDSCAKSGDGWYSEAPITVYQCLNQSDEWYMLQCTEDGRGLIGIDYTENCEERLNETVFYDGCDYKDKYIEIRHCDYWDGHSEIDVDTTSTSTTTTTTSTTTTTTQGPRTSTTAGTTSLTRFLSTVSTMIDDGGHGHHGHHGDHSSSHDGHDGHHGGHGRGHGRGSDSSSSEDGEDRLARMHPMLLLAVCGLCVVLFTVCCCVSCKYLKQKQQIAALAAMVDSQDGQREGDKTTVVVKQETTATVLLDEGEEITIR